MRRFIKRNWKYFILAGFLCAVFLPATAVMARAGGSVGGGGFGGGGGGGYSGYSGGSYGSGNSFGFFNRSRYLLLGGRRFGYSFGGIFVFGLLAFFGTRRIMNFANGPRRIVVAPRNLVHINDVLEHDFSKLFYKVQNAWAANDQDTLQRVMAPHYFGKQKRILDGYTRAGKISHMENIVIVTLEEEVTGRDDTIHVVVTAQMRDYFEFKNENQTYNDLQRDRTNIERFTEVWEMHREQGQLIVDNIQQN